MMINKLKKLWKMAFPGIQAKRVKPWFAADGDMTYRLDYPELDENAIVVDLGGYKGQWASDMYGKYLCKVYVFEPATDFLTFIKKRFERNQSIFSFPFALGNENKQEVIYINADRSSSVEKRGKPAMMEFRKFDEMMMELSVERIDLIKINIEGGEYELLEYLINIGWISRIKNIQVQFHDFFPGAKERMERIQEQLKQTHTVTYQFEFVWENWKLKNS